MHLILTSIRTVLWFFLSVMLLTFICRRKRVRVFKFGPDYLDPQILERASKAPVVQLDLWMAGEAWCKQQICLSFSNPSYISHRVRTHLTDGKAWYLDRCIYFYSHRKYLKALLRRAPSGYKAKANQTWSSLSTRLSSY